MENEDNKITVRVVGAIVVIACVALVVLAVESGRKADLALAQLREIRATMGEAGYLPAEPKIVEAKR